MLLLNLQRIVYYEFYKINHLNVNICKTYESYS